MQKEKQKNGSDTHYFVNEWFKLTTHAGIQEKDFSSVKSLFFKF
jgi:hypothetical protein